jgi:hypothetical protein
VTDTNNKEGGEGCSKQVEDELNELIDLMTLAEEPRLTEQMKELEQLEAEKKLRYNNLMRTPPNTATTDTNTLLGLTKEKSPLMPTTAGGLFAAFMKKSPQDTNNASTTTNKLNNFLAGADLAPFAASSSSSTSTSANPLLSANLKSINDLFTNVNDEFEREWQSVLQHQQQQPQQQHNQAASSGSSLVEQQHSATISPSATTDEFGLFGLGSEGQELGAGGAAASLMFPSSIMGQKGAGLGDLSLFHNESSMAGERKGPTMTAQGQVGPNVGNKVSQIKTVNKIY